MDGTIRFHAVVLKTTKYTSLLYTINDTVYVNQMHNLAHV